MINNLLTIKKKNGDVVIFNGQFLYRKSEGYVLLFLDHDERMTITVNNIEDLCIGDYAVIRDGVKL
jgi:hypothetical protein